MSGSLRDGSPAPRVVFNDDGYNFLNAWDDLGADDLHAYLRRLSGTHVDVVAYCVAEPFVALYPTGVGEMLGTGHAYTDGVQWLRIRRNLERLEAEGGYVRTVVRTLRELGISPLLSIRLNDAHVSSDPEGPLASAFWRSHPQWRLGEAYGYYASCLSYAVPEVRATVRAVVREIVERFPEADGIELDAMRSPFFFPPGRGPEMAPIFTGFVRTLRDDLDRAGARCGRRYRLTANVPRSPEAALEAGLDTAAWDAEGLVDWVAAGCYAAEMQLPMEAWAEQCPRTPALAYINCSPQTGQYYTRRQYRAAAANAWAAGARGIYLFNFPCLDELSNLVPRELSERIPPPADLSPTGRHPDLRECAAVLDEVGDSQTLRRLDKDFFFYGEPPAYRHQPDEVAFLERAEPAPLTARFRCYEEYPASRRLALRWKVVNVLTDDGFAFALNGRAIPAERLRRRHAPAGRDARLHGVRLGPYSLFTVELSPEDMVQGENALSCQWLRGDERLFGRIELRELELEVRYE